MPIRIVQVHHVSVLGLLFLSAMVMQGCLAMVWLGAVGVDMTRTSEVEFQPFENTWMVALQERQQLGVVKSIAVMPFAGDPVMAEGWTAVFREMTDLRVVGPSETTKDRISEQEQIGPGQRSVEPQVDCVLIGKVADQEPTKTFAGLKENLSRRLYLQLVTNSGTLMWKTELPYAIEKGAKNLDEEVVTKALLTHVRAHAGDIGLAELGVRSQRIASRSLHN
jgi:hypothetical protein